MDTEYSPEYDVIWGQKDFGDDIIKRYRKNKE